MTGRCRVCGAATRGGRFAWFGWYRWRCDNGHRYRLATPRRAAKNWRRLNG